MKRVRTLLQNWVGFRRLTAHFWPAIRKQWPLVSFSLLAVLTEAIFRALEPWPLKFIFDRMFSGKHHHSLAIPALDRLDPAILVTLAALATVLITGLRGLADYVNTVGFAKIGNRIFTEVRGDLYRHLLRLPLSFHSRARSGDLMLRVMSDINMLKDVTVTALLPLLVQVAAVAVLIAVMFWLHWRLALLSLSVLPLLGVFTIRFGRRIRQTARDQRKRESVMAANAIETIGAIKLVQALCLEGIFDGQFSRRNRESQRASVKGTRLMAALGRTVSFLTAASTALVVWYGARLVLRGELTPGDLLVFLAYLKHAFRPIQEFARYTGRLAKATAGGERVLDVLGQSPEIHDLPGAVPAPPFRGAVRFEDVSFAYEPDQPVFEGINFEVQPGQRIALVGPSGIGKSTLVNLLLRLCDPIRGRVLIDGRDIRDYTLASLRAQISVVLQDTLLFAASARDNIAFGAPGATPEAIEAAARLANAHEFIVALPEGYESVLGERGMTLSGGQRQRIALARAALREAPILILDEPTTGLDQENERMVLEALAGLAEGPTTFFVTHDLQLAAKADMILYLEGGRVRECGRHEELLQVNGRYAGLYGLQVAAPDAAPWGGSFVSPANGEDRSKDGTKPCHSG